METDENTNFYSKKWSHYWRQEKFYSTKIEKKIREKIEDDERKKIETDNKNIEIKRLNNLAIEEYCSKENHVQTTTNIHGILSKTEIEILVRYAYKLLRDITDDSDFYVIDRDRIEPFSRPQLIHFKDIDIISLLERYLKATPQMFKLVDLRDYLKGNRKNKKILSVFINDFDMCNFSHIKISHYTRGKYLFDSLHHLLRDRVLLIAYIDKLKNSNSNKKIQLEWNLNETQIIYLYNQFIENNIIDKSVRLGLFYQVFNNQVANFDTSIQINPKILACFLFWSRNKNILLNIKPYKIIENLKMFCNKKGKNITAHMLNRYVSEPKVEFIECATPEYEKIKEIIDNL